MVSEPAASERCDGFPTTVRRNSRRLALARKTRAMCREARARKAGLPDFSWYMIPKPEKNVPNEHKMYQMVMEYPIHMSIKYSKWPLNI
jgi:hypothetical protein